LLLLMERTVTAPPQTTLIIEAKDNMDQQKPITDPTPLDKLGDTPQWVDCPFCHRRTETRLETKQLGPVQM
jgi:hypothetical protein